jgi:hypothetical protein
MLQICINQFDIKLSLDVRCLAYNKITTLLSFQKEKDQLMQQVRVEPAVGKIAEQRRKRIQELEQSIQVEMI